MGAWAPTSITPLAHQTHNEGHNELQLIGNFDTEPMKSDLANLKFEGPEEGSGPGDVCLG